MAVKKNPVNDERVEIYIPRGAANDDPNLFVSVNAVNYLLPRGKTSMVPRHIADEVKRALAAQEAQDRRVVQMLAESARAARAGTEI